jgi:glutaredoxin
MTVFMNGMKLVAQTNELDITSDEDLGMGIMNLVSIEEHLFLTASKTGKDHYYDLLLEVREMRKELLKKIVVSSEGEVWCISKHLLASSMRLMEVGTKELKINGIVRAKPYFEKSYRLFRLFWETVLRQPEQEHGEQHAVVSLTKDVVIFYEPTCPHCKALESFISANGLNEMFNIRKSDVTSDPANRAEMESAQQICMKDVSERVVPFVTHGGKCAMGEENSIQFFKNLVWDNAQESKTSMESLLVGDAIPVHIKTHVENYNKAVDAALNCCKE